LSGDGVDDGPLLDELPASDIVAYCTTTKGLLELPVDVVHWGDDRGFGRARPEEIAHADLPKRC
jgi:hypothetical protein